MKKRNTKECPAEGACVRISLSVPAAVAGNLDALVRRKGAASRSALAADLLRGAAIDDASLRDTARAAGALVLFYDHHARGLQERLTSLQHDAGELILSALHVHLDAHHCLEILAVRGRAGDLRTMANRIETTRGILRAQLCITAVVPGHLHPHTPQRTPSHE